MNATLQTQDIATEVYNYTLALIEALKHNYIQYSIRSHQRSLFRDLNHVTYHEEQIDKLKQGICPIDYVIETGKKYHKLIMIDSGNSRSVHAFIDKQTGQVYKSASWKAPAKGVRYDLMNEQSREDVLQNCDWSGGYLYAN
jgi:hypothetical protein